MFSGKHAFCQVYLFTKTKAVVYSEGYMRFLRAISVLAAGFLAFLGSVSTAQADPHAVFYTAVGQQQLFFNVLAALDQADYVEPADGAQGVSRAELERDRSDTAFGDPSDDPRLSTTRTNLSSVLTRNITLEGYDLWTAYQLQNRANDFQKTVAIAELARLFCQEALGIPLCDTENSSAYAKRANAIVTDPVERELLPIERGALAVLLSGSPQDQEIRRHIVNEFKEDPFAWEYNPSIAAAWAAVSGDNNTAKRALLDSMLSDTLSAFVPTQVDPSVYERIASVNSDGTIERTYGLAAALPSGTVLAQDSQALSGLDFASQVVSDMYGLLRNKAAALDIAIAAEQNVRNEQSSDNEGFKAVTYSTSQAANNGGSASYERLGTRILSPAESRVAATHALKESGIITENARTSAPIEGQFRPGQEELLLPFDVSNGAVQGTQTSAQTQPTGQVAGFFDDVVGGILGGLFGSLGNLGQAILNFYIQDQQSDVPIQGEAANLQPIYREQGLQDALTALDPAFRSDDSGFSPGTQSAWAQYCSTSNLCN